MYANFSRTLSGCFVISTCQQGTQAQKKVSRRKSESVYVCVSVCMCVYL